MKTHTGLTLVELVVAVAVAAILLAVAVPSWTSVVQANRSVSDANSLVAALQFARTEAVKRGMRVSVCASANPNANSPTCAGNGNWHTGWIVFTDNTGASGTKDSSDSLLKVWGALPSGTTLTATGSAASAQFLSTGFSAAVREFTLKPAGCINKNQRLITLTAQGRSHVTPETCT